MKFKNLRIEYYFRKNKVMVDGQWESLKGDAKKCFKDFVINPEMHLYSRFYEPQTISEAANFNDVKIISLACWQFDFAATNEALTKNTKAYFIERRELFFVMKNGHILGEINMQQLQDLKNYKNIQFYLYRSPEFVLDDKTQIRRYPIVSQVEFNPKEEKLEGSYVDTALNIIESRENLNIIEHEL